MTSQALALREEDLKLLLAANVHVGTKSCDANMERYVWKRKRDGIYLINLGKTWEKLVLAARIIVAIENPEDVIAISARPYGQRAVLKFGSHIGCNSIAGRYTPGCFTNQLQIGFTEPRLIIATDPRIDHQPIKEAAAANIPVIAFCSTDSPVRGVDVVIPCNNKWKHSVALMYWLLAREVNRMRGVLSRQQKWDVMVDLYMYKEIDEAQKEATVAEAEEAVVENANFTTEVPANFDGSTPAGDWTETRASFDPQWGNAAAATEWN